MTYLQFHFIFILPPIVLLLWYLRGLDGPSHKVLWKGIGFIIVLALLYTTPWDNYLVYKGVWTYPPERVLFTIGYVPIEEYLFFVLMTILTGLWTFIFHRKYQPAAADLQPRFLRPRIVGTLAVLLVGVFGVFCLFSENTLYLGLILAWAAPIIALHWAYAGDWMWQRMRVWGLAVFLPTVYLCATDLFAIRNGIWSIHPKFTTGLHAFGLPLEEALFFLIANILVVQGTWTFWMTFDRAAALREHSVKKINSF